MPQSRPVGLARRCAIGYSTRDLIARSRIRCTGACQANHGEEAMRSVDVFAAKADPSFRSFGGRRGISRRRAGSPGLPDDCRRHVRGRWWRCGPVAVHRSDEPGRRRSALASIEVDLSPVKEGQAITVKWRGKPVFIRNRTKKEIEEAAKVAARICRTTGPQRQAAERRPPTDANRVKKGKENWLVMIGICTHLGCIPKGQAMGEQGRLRRLVLPVPRLAVRHRRAASAKARRRETSRCRHTRSSPTPRSRSAEEPARHGGARIDLRAEDRHRASGRTRACRSSRLVHGQFVDFPTPRNLNYFWTFGGILTFCLVVQIVTGIVLAMHYQPSAAMAFNSRRAHPARRELRLAAAQLARGRRLDVLHRRLHPHLPRPLLRLLQGPARSALDPRRVDLPR